MTDEAWRSTVARAAVLDAHADTIDTYSTLIDAGDQRVSALTLELGIKCGGLPPGTSDDDAIVTIGNWWRARSAELVKDPTSGDEACALLERFSQLEIAPGNAIETMFSALWSMTRDACDEDGPALPDAHLSIEPLGPHPRGGADRYYVGATTKAAGAVVLKIQPDHLGPHVWALLPRVLLHELLCHVAAGDPDPANSISTFSEGLADWASCYFLRAWALDALGPLSQAARSHAERSFDLLTPSTTQAGRARRNGHRAAEAMVDALISVTGLDRAAAEAQVSRLIHRINRLELPRRQKEAVVLRLARREPPFLGAPLHEAIHPEFDLAAHL